MTRVVAVTALLFIALSPLAGEEPQSPDAAYITALEAYQQAELAVHQGRVVDAKQRIKEALAARDIAVSAYRLRANEPEIQRRLGELLALDRPCCGKPSLRTTLSADPQ